MRKTVSPVMTGRWFAQEFKESKNAETTVWRVQLRFSESFPESETHSAHTKQKIAPHNIAISQRKIATHNESLTLPPGFE
jgi:hypothetical protein